MDQELFKALTIWGEARKATKDNASLLLKSNFDEKVLNLCADRMNVFYEAEQHLFSFEGRNDLPKPLMKFLSAYQDRGCTACTMSSSLPTHAECARLMNIYFRAIAELETYVYKFLV